MTPRQRVLAAINHQRPDRVPFSWGLGLTDEMIATMNGFCAGDGYTFDALRLATEDVLTITPDYIGPSLADDTDVWGVRRKGVSYGTGHYDEVVHCPLADATEVADLAEVQWPSAEWWDFTSLADQVKAEDPDHLHAHRLCIACSGNPLERYTWMTGLEQTLVNLLIGKDLVHSAMQSVTDHFLEMMRRSVAAVGDWIDIFYLADDLGGQETLLMSRATYREMIQPYHAQLTARARELLPGAKVMFHTDGAVFDVLPDLIDAGVQILEAVQTDAGGMDPGRLKSAFGQELSFHGGIPVQSLLPDGTVGEVAAGTADLCRIFGADGGYIAAPSHAIQMGTPPENVMAMLGSVLGPRGLQDAITRARSVRR